MFGNVIICGYSLGLLPFIMRYNLRSIQFTLFKHLIYLALENIIEKGERENNNKKLVLKWKINREKLKLLFIIMNAERWMLDCLHIAYAIGAFQKSEYKIYPIYLTEWTDQVMIQIYVMHEA